MEASTGAVDRDEVRVSTLELFFDLVFVFTITQLTALLVHDPKRHQPRPDRADADRDLVDVRGIRLAHKRRPAGSDCPPACHCSPGMAAFFVITLTIPTAFSADGVVFASGYLAVIVIHTALYTQSATWSVASVWSFARMNLVAAALILAGTIIGDAWQYVLWGLAIPIFAITPALVPEDSGWIRPSHFVERHGLVVIVALGESVVAVGIGASGLEISGELLLVAVLGLALSAELWWVYFGGDDEEAEGSAARDAADQAGVHRRQRRLLLGPPPAPSRDRLRRPRHSSTRSVTPSTRSTSPLPLPSEVEQRFTSSGTPSSASFSASHSVPGAGWRRSSPLRRSRWEPKRQPWLSWRCWSPSWGSASWPRVRRPEAKRGPRFRRRSGRDEVAGAIGSLGGTVRGPGRRRRPHERRIARSGNRCHRSSPRLAEGLGEKSGTAR